jgi:hypothetical protein
MYAIKAEFDGTKITPKETIPVNVPYEAIVTFTRPKAQPQPKESILDFADIFVDREDVAIIEELRAEGRRKAVERLTEMDRTGVDPLQKHCGALKDVFPEGGLEYQRRIRDEWPD